jgi:hypothetical protein
VSEPDRVAAAVGDFLRQGKPESCGRERH